MNLKDRVRAHILTLPMEEEIHVYTLDAYTLGDVKLRKYIGHLLYVMCHDEHLLEKTRMLEHGAKKLTVYKRKAVGEDEEVVVGHPLQHFWKGI